MSSRHPNFTSHVRALLASVSLSCVALPAAAQQQQVAELPAITVTQSRLFERTVAVPLPPKPVTTRRVRSRSRVAAPPVRSPVQQPVPYLAATASIGIVGASTSIITAEDIRRSPAQNIPDILAQTPGVQIQTLYGGVNGANTIVDLRGFGATGASNTLVLINGRRVTDVDFAAIDFSAIPRDSIERIEITRGNSGAVLYGDNAVGGVINIVTKTGVGGPPISGRVEAGFGSFNQKIGTASVFTNNGPWSSSITGFALKSDGYRANNALEQQAGIGEVRYTTPDFSAFLNLSGDNQRLRLPGARTVDPSIGVNQLATDRRGTDTPLNYADKQGVNATAGFTKSLINGVDLIVDGGVRDKRQQLAFFGTIPLQDFNITAVDSALQTWSITPRLKITNPVFGLPSTILTGIDYYDADYRQNRGMFLNSAPYHVYNLRQQTLAGYFQQTLGILPSTDISYGGRIQQMRLGARDRYDPTAPGAFDAQALPLDSNEINHALHVGIEHRLTNNLALFGRAASAFRTPNVDERVASGPSFDADFNPIPQNFKLRTQTSNDIEGGVRAAYGPLKAQASIYNMNLKNELQFDPVNFFNRNLDPTRRYGGEVQGSVQVNPDLLFRGGAAVTRAVFTKGQFTGNDVPLVSRYTANAGVTWNIWQRYVVFDATARFWSSRRMDNDQGNAQPVIPANATVDLKLSGEIDRFFWSASVNNLFDVLYYDYAVASTFTPGRFNAYPLPGRTFLLKAGVVF